MQRAGDVVRHVLAADTFGPVARYDFVYAEVNRAELPRAVPHGSGRRGYVYADIAVPAKALVLDVFVHRDIYPAVAPELSMYDTAIGGIADVNDRSRDLDRLDLAETCRDLGRGLTHAAIPGAPRNAALTEHVVARLGWDAADFRHYRVHVEYLVYGSQVTRAFQAPEA